MRRTDPHAFDELAADYEAGIDDPWRGRFAATDEFFIHQKCRAMTREVGRRGPAMAPHPLALDVGCGKGPALAFFQHRWRMVGADVSQGMLRGAPTGLKLVVQEPFALPFADHTFDIVYAFCVYHHIERRDHERHFDELVRVVRPGGHVFVFEHNPFNPVTRIIFRRALVDRGCRMLAPAYVRRLFEGSGLRAVTTGYMLFLPETLARWFGRVEDALRWLPFGGQYFVAGTKSE